MVVIFNYDRGLTYNIKLIPYSFSSSSFYGRYSNLMTEMHANKRMYLRNKHVKS